MANLEVIDADFEDILNHYNNFSESLDCKTRCQERIFSNNLTIERVRSLIRKETREIKLKLSLIRDYQESIEKGSKINEDLKKELKNYIDKSESNLSKIKSSVSKYRKKIACKTRISHEGLPLKKRFSKK